MRLSFLAAAIAAAALVLIWALPVFAQEEIESTGPLTRIITSPTLSCQVKHRDDEEFEFFPSFSEEGDCGTFLALGGSVYGPLGGRATVEPWTPAAQTAAVGSGRAGDPFRVVTTVEAAGAGIRIDQTDSYVVGTQSYRTDVAITNTTSAVITGVLYRAGDCYLQGDDSGFVRVDGGAPACIVDPAEGRRIEQWTPITPGSHFYAGFFGTTWQLIGSQEQFPDRCECEQESEFDNGAGLSWPVNLAPGQTTTISHETFFSPVGRGPVQQSFTDSVPTSLILDPVIVATSIAVTAGVIVLVPFPSALFNSTLEENYDEVMAGVARVRAWLRRTWGRFLAWFRGQIASRRARSGKPLTQPILDPSSTHPAAQSATAEPAATVPTLARVDFWRTPQGVILFVLASALLYGFLDPTFGLDLNSVATFAGLALGLVIVLAAYGVPLLVFARSRRIPLTVRALPATLLIGVLCVVLSRVVNFQPGYLYGLVIGFIFARDVAREHEARAEAIAAGSSLLVALLAWVALALLRGGAVADQSLVTAALEAASVTIVVAGLENAVFAMLPLRFLPGAAVFAWDRRIWAVLIGLGLFGFVHVLLNPTAGYLADTTRTSFLTLVVLLVAFAVASVLFWGWFRFRPKKQASA